MMERLKNLLRSDYGRNHGWFIEEGDEVLGELAYSEPEDMFWDTYKIEVLSERGQQILWVPEEWDDCRFRYRNRGLDEYAFSPFPEGSPGENLKQKRISMRGLYLCPQGFLERIMANFPWLLGIERPEQRTDPAGPDT